ncbi:MAG TPA: methyltransferase domain-containing protein [Rhodothermales bacterium]|nr:methyltransferase domain-containing protein [Rhodothermales bacterium]
MQQPSDHVLRTFASVPYTNRVLNLCCDRYTEPLMRLGFDIQACDTDLGKVVAARTELADQLEAEQQIIHVARREALGYPDAFFDWIIAFDVFDADAEKDEVIAILTEARRVLKPGGWIYVAHTLEEDEEEVTPELMQAMLTAADFAVAEEPVVADEAGCPIVRGIFRRVEADTPL